MMMKGRSTRRAFARPAPLSAICAHAALRDVCGFESLIETAREQLGCALRHEAQASVATFRPERTPDGKCSDMVVMGSTRSGSGQT
jgi:hypothetical protein